jgi:folate-binding Fe-S cluster repair protein YgfZ
MQGNELKSVEAGHRGSWCDPGRLSWVGLSWADAARFLDNFTTAAVGPLAVGAGTETFFTDSRGWVIALAMAHDRALELERGRGEALRSQLPMLALMVLLTVAGLWSLSAGMGT